MSEDYHKRHSAQQEEAGAAPVGSALAPEKEKEELLKIKADLKGKSECNTE